MCYCQQSGATCSWTDLNGWNVDATIRIRTSPPGLPQDVEQVNDILPTTFRLGQNYPNPFNPATAIDYDLPARAAVTLTVFDVLGRTVTTLVNEVQPAGQHIARWDGADYHGNPVASGVYFYRLIADDSRLTRKMLLLK
jgi:hypothetical protein